MTDELRNGSRLGSHELHAGFPVGPRADTVALRPGRRPSQALTEKVLDPVPVHSFPSRKPTRTPAWIYAAGALTVLAGLLMLTMLVLILRSG